MTNSTRRRWPTRLTRESILPLVVFAATIALVLSSTLMARRSARANRAMATRALGDFAELAAWSFAFRGHAAFINAGWFFSKAVGPVALDAREPDVPRLLKTVDSIAQCNCELALKARGFAIGRWKDSTSVHYRAVPGQHAANLVAINRALAYATKTPLADETVDLRSGGSGDSAWLLLVIPARGFKPSDKGFIAIDLDIPFTNTHGFASVFRGADASLFLPQPMVRVDRNRSLAEMTVTSTAGEELYRSPVPHRTGFRGSVPLGLSGTIKVTAELSDSAARGILRGAIPVPSVMLEVAMPVLALLLSGAVALALYRAHSLARQRSEFAASVTHELRTPLTQILLSGETLALDRARDPAERGRMQDVIVREARRLVYLIENVLHFSRADRRMLRLTPRAVQVDTLLVEHLHDLQSLVSAAGSRVVLATLPRLVAHVDPNGLKLVLTNIVDNALHYAPGKDVHVSMTSSAESIEVIIDDAGAGIAPEHRVRALRAFERLGEAELLHPSGSGIGLAVVHELMRGMGGELILDVSPQGGLRVRLKLRAAHLPDERSASAA